MIVFSPTPTKNGINLIYLVQILMVRHKPIVFTWFLIFCILLICFKNIPELVKDTFQ